MLTPVDGCTPGISRSVTRMLGTLIQSLGSVFLFLCPASILHTSQHLSFSILSGCFHHLYFSLHSIFLRTGFSVNVHSAWHTSPGKLEFGSDQKAHFTSLVGGFIIGSEHVLF